MIDERGTATGPVDPGALPRFMRWESVGPLVGTRPTRSIVAAARTLEECREALDFCRRHGLSLCPRGAGHSYGDQALNDGNVLLDVRGLDRILEFDETTGRMVVEAGVPILDIYRRAHPLLWTLPASPSEATITVAGAIANNVNGKDSWRAGNFGDRVVALRLLTADGHVRSLDRETGGELFRAVIGGMGLLGVVVEATLELERIPSPFVETSRVDVKNTAELVERLARAEAESDFAIAWMDIYARRANQGRSVLHTTRWIPRPGADARREVAAGLDRLTRGREKARLLHGLLNHFIRVLLHSQRRSVRLFNKSYFVFCALRNRLPFISQQELFIEYNFFPNLQIPPAALLCGPWGYTIQILIPREGAGESITKLVRICRRMPCPPVTTVLRLHRADDYLISFAEDGYSLNFEFHLKERHVARMRPKVDDLVECALRYGGKIHLAKDMILRPEQFRRMYPGHRAFAEIKRRLDPGGLFRSEMYRRLFLDA